LEDEERDHENRDQRQDHVAVERNVHSWRRIEEPTDQRYRDGRENENGKDVDCPREERAPRAGEVKAEDPVDQEVERPNGDHEETPEDERVRETAEVVRTLEELALSEVDDELVTHATPRMVDARLIATESHVPVETPRAPEECPEAQRGQCQQHRAPRDEAAGGRGHGFTPSGSPRR